MDAPLLLIAFHFPPESATGAVRPGRLFQYFPEFGYCPEVITAADQPTSIQDRIHCIPAPMRDFPNKRTLEGIGELVLRKYVLPTEQAIFWSVRAARLGAEILYKRPGPILSTSPPLNTHLAALRLKKRYGLPWLADLRDPFYGNPYRPQRGAGAWLDRRLEAMIFRHADAIMGVTDIMVERWSASYPQWKDKMQVIWNGFNPVELLCAEPIPARPHRLLLHLGTLYGPRHPMAVLESIQRLTAIGRLAPGRIQVHLVGDIAVQILRANEVLIRSLTEAGVVKFMPVVPRSEALSMMSQSDYLMLLDLHDGAESHAVPAKLYEYIRVGRPVLALTTPNSPVERILSLSGIAHELIYPQHSGDQVDERLLRFLSLPSEPAAPSAWFLENFDGRRQTEAVAQILDRIGERSRGRS
jgi:hypothetical protein